MSNATPPMHASSARIASAGEGEGAHRRRRAATAAARQGECGRRAPRAPLRATRQLGRPQEGEQPLRQDVRALEGRRRQSIERVQRSERATLSRGRFCVASVAAMTCERTHHEDHAY